MSAHLWFSLHTYTLSCDALNLVDILPAPKNGESLLDSMWGELQPLSAANQALN